MDYNKLYKESREKSYIAYKEYMDITPYDKMALHMKKIIQDKLYGIQRYSK